MCFCLADDCELITNGTSTDVHYRLETAVSRHRCHVYTTIFPAAGVLPTLRPTLAWYHPAGGVLRWGPRWRGGPHAGGGTTLAGSFAGGTTLAGSFAGGTTLAGSCAGGTTLAGSCAGDPTLAGSCARWVLDVRWGFVYASGSAGL